MAVELGALSVPIQAPGLEQTLAGLGALDRAGTKANASLEQGATRVGRSWASLAETQRAATQGWVALERTAVEFTAAAEQQAGTLAERLLPALEQYRADIRAIQEDLLRGRLTTIQATQSAAASAAVYQQQSAALRGTAIATRQTGGAVAILTGQQVRAQGGIRTVTRFMANQAAMTIGLRSGLGGVAASLGALSLGAMTSLGVIAGLAAIAKGFQLIRQRADEARRATKAAVEAHTESLTALQALRAEEDPLSAATEKLRQALSEDKLAREGVAQATDEMAAAEKVLTAIKSRSTETTRDADRAAVDFLKATNDLTEARRRAVDADLRAATAANMLAIAAAARQKADQQATDEEDRRQKDREQAAQALMRAAREETEALVALSASGRATGRDLVRLVDIEKDLAAVATLGTAAHRAETQALLEKVKAANQFNLVPRMARPTGVGTIQPAPTAFPGAAPTGVTSLDELIDRTSITSLSALAAAAKDGSTSFETFRSVYGALGEDVDRLDIGVRFAEMASDIHLLEGALLTGAVAWTQMWESIGAGGNAIQALGGFLAAMARQLAQMAAAKALLAFADAILFHDPSKAKAGALYLAAAAAFSMIAGAVGGGGTQSGTSGSGRASFDREEFYRVTPRLQPGGRSAVAERASQLNPLQPLAIQVGPVIGTNDPQAQRDIARLVANAVNRGYALGRA
jgi:hypothetical protein